MYENGNETRWAGSIKKLPVLPKSYQFGAGGLVAIDHGEMSYTNGPQVSFLMDHRVQR